MILVNNELLNEYLKNDYILKVLKDEQAYDHKFTSHKWLKESPPKRMIFNKLYGDLINAAPNYNILDVGGGFSSISSIFIKRHNYLLLDIMTHDDHTILKNMENEYGKQFWINQDWNEYTIKDKQFDIVIANDLFPNVDQRVEIFLEKYIPVTKEIRLSLTFYNYTRFYKVKRVDADEILFVLAWNGKQLREVIKKYHFRILNYNPELFEKENRSIFANNRQIIILTLKGEK